MDDTYYQPRMRSACQRNGRWLGPVPVMEHYENHASALIHLEATLKRNPADPPVTYLASLRTGEYGAVIHLFTVPAGRPHHPDTVVAVRLWQGLWTIVS